MYFPATHRHLPRRNVLPLQTVRDDAARRQVARMAAEVEQLRRDLQTPSGPKQAKPSIPQAA